MSYKNHWTISTGYDFQVHLQRSQIRCCFAQTALLWIEVLPEMSQALPDLSPALPVALRLVVGAPKLVVGAPSYSEGRQECPPTVRYSPEIDASKFSLHILSDTPGGFQWQKYVLLMLCNVTRRLGEGKRVNLCRRVWGSVRAVRAVRNTRVFRTETRVVADELHHLCANYTAVHLSQSIHQHKKLNIFHSV